MRISTRGRRPAGATPLRSIGVEPEVRQQMACAAALVAGSVLAFAIPAAFGPWRGDRVRVVVIATLMVVTAASGLAGGRRAGVHTAVMAGCSLDFFHDSTPHLLSLTTTGFWTWTAGFVGTALVAATAAAGVRGLAKERP